MKNPNTARPSVGGQSNQIQGTNLTNPTLVVNSRERAPSQKLITATGNHKRTAT